MESRRQIGRKTWSNHTVIAFLSAVYLSISIGLLAFDRITKLYALEHLRGEHIVNRFLSFELVVNRGVSWGLFHSSSTLIFLAVTTVAFLATVFLGIYAYKRACQGYSVLGEVLVISGSASNILDRFLYNGVIDFILVHTATWSWPVFNIADAAIVLGASCMFIQLIKQS